MASAPQHVLDLLNSLIHSYPTGLPEGIHLNINLDVNLAAANTGSGVPVNEPADLPEVPPAGAVYKGPFLGLYRVVANNDSHRIKVRSDSDGLAPEITMKLEARHLAFMKALNPAKPTYLETNGYIYETNDSVPKTLYKQYAFDGQLLVVAETMRVGKTVMGRIVGIGSDPLKSDPKPLDAAHTNNILTPWLVHQIPGILVYVPILSSDTEAGWVNMDELEKIR
jgi:hypothetical protein